ncbi:hypothetical protein ACP70R_011767 [Stipagrostis hirtigluma subsp. patula]
MATAARSGSAARASARRPGAGECGTGRREATRREAAPGGALRVAALAGLGGRHWRREAARSGGQLALLVFLLGFLYCEIQPPPAKIPGSPGGPPVTAPRAKLKDGRHLAYLKSGIPKDQAKYKIIFVHGLDCGRYDRLNVSHVRNWASTCCPYDRPSYGQSDAHPARTEKNIALDMAELADNLQLGPKFHLVGFSMSGEIMWGCLKYIPHRLAGVAILALVGNYWWSGFPPDVLKEAWHVQFPQDRHAVWVAHHLPWLTQWWNIQRLFPSSSVKAGNPAILSKEDTPLTQKIIDRAHMAAGRA